LNLSGVSPVGGLSSPQQTQGILWVGSRTVTNGPGGNISAGPGGLAAKVGAPRPMSINRYWLDGELRNHGTLNVSAELTVTYPGAVHTNAGAIQINDGFLAFPESLNNSGTINFNGLVASAGALQPLLRGSGIWIQASALNNTPSGTLNVLATVIGGARIEAALTNQGALNINAPLTLTKPGAVHTNTGTINLLATFAGHEPFTNFGTVNLGMTPLTNAKDRPTPNAIIWLPGARVTNGPGGTINALQRAVVEAQLVNQGTLNVNATMVLTQPGSTHTNTGTINLNNDLEIGGGFSNAGVINFNSAITPTGALQPSLRGHVIWIQESALNNAPSGTLNVLAPVISATLPAAPRAGNATIQAQLINQGTLNISSSLEISATGLIHHNSGVINVLADASFRQPLTNAGTVSVTAATLSVAGVYTQTAGLTAMNGTLSVPEAWLLGGTLRGAGDVDGNLINAARVAPGNSPGALSVGKHYTQLPSGSLDIELGGTTPETGYDVLSVGGDAILSGTLNVTLVNAFTPANGNTFTFLNASSRSGVFSTLTGVTLDAGKRLAPIYGDDFARLLMLGRVTFLPQLLK
jgi:hypothetical protein